MSCSKPLLAFVCGKLENGKKDIRFARFKEQTCYVKDGIPYTEKIEIPCGQCIGCRLQYSRQWADRLMMELEDHEDAWFLTLTYDDEHIPKTYYGDPRDGSALCAYTLRKKDLQDFFKRLRYYYPNCRLRLFACGELGDRSKRPHYHAIVYGLKLEDLKVYKLSGLGDFYYNSEKLQKVWNKGYVVVGAVSWESCAYVARYVVKKAKGITKESYDLFNMEPEFVTMSRSYGIGKKYLERNYEKLYKYGETYISSEKGGIKCKPPRYFNQKMEEQIDGVTDKSKRFVDSVEFKEIYENYKNNLSKKGKAMTNNKLALTDVTLEELREIEEYAMIERTKALRREL